jgi:hypothetical protein
MKLNRPFFRFLLGLVCALILVTGGFAWAAASIPAWGATPDEISRTLPGDEIVDAPELVWDNAITIRAAPEQIYPWLAQMGDTRGGFYSFTFIENLFMIAAGQSGRYINASQVHPEWQNPPNGTGMISDYMALIDYKANQYVLASATPKFFGMHWTWLWALQPVGPDAARLIVRHRFAFPQGMNRTMMVAVLDAGYVMERGMLLGIRDRAEGTLPPAYAEALGIALWLAALSCGLLAAVRFVRKADAYHPLGVGLEAVVVLFIFTFIQPVIWLRVVLDLVLVASLVIAYQPGKVSQFFRERASSGALPKEAK